MHFSPFIFLVLFGAAVSFNCYQRARELCSSYYAALDKSDKFCSAYKNLYNCIKEKDRFCTGFFEFAYFHKCVTHTTPSSGTRYGVKVRSVMAIAVVGLIITLT